MIKRTYFFSCQCPKNDGNGSYSFWSSTTTVRSWLPKNINELHSRLCSDAKKQFIEKGIENPSLDIQAFNRI